MTQKLCHPTDAALSELIHGLPSIGDRMRMADHIAGCPSCADRLAQLAQDPPVFAPRGFEETVLTAIASIKEKSRREYRLYVLRVAACVAVLVGIAASGWFASNPIVVPSQDPVPVAAPPEVVIPPPSDDPDTFSSAWNRLLEQAKIAFINIKEEVFPDDSSKK